MTRIVNNRPLRQDRSIAGVFRLVVERDYSRTETPDVDFSTEKDAREAAEVIGADKNVTTITVMQCKPVHRMVFFNSPSTEEVRHNYA